MLPIVLIGGMGSGKSKVGPMLGNLLNLPTYDLDGEIEARESRDIPTIFSESGEAYFREQEFAAFQSLLLEPPGIIITGGGAPMHAQFWDERNRFVAIFIDPDLAVLWGRLEQKMESRPLLKNAENPKEVLFQLMELRRPTYLKADIVYPISNPDLTGEENAQNIASLVQQFFKK
mgnify:CR=1 FL=1